LIFQRCCRDQQVQCPWPDPPATCSEPLAQTGATLGNCD
jgi:hypothetical protein